jgi:ABC-type nitrate/sulfonate/bicarbonate transport system permease component
MNEIEKVKKKRGKKNLIAYSFLSVFVFLFIWWLFTESGLTDVKPTVLPGPFRVLSSLIDKFTNTRPDGATIQVHLWASLKITLIGYIFGCLVGIPLGIFMGWYEKVDIFIRPLFDFIRAVPGIAWTPLFILLFGIGLLPKVVVIALATFGPVLINTYTGICQTKEVHIWVGQTFGASKLEILLKIAIPSAIPYILTGLRVGLGVAWSTIIGAEMLAATAGLGYLINLCRGIYRPDIIIAAMFCVGLVGAALGYLLTLLEHRLMRGGRW